MDIHMQKDNMVPLWLSAMHCRPPGIDTLVWRGFQEVTCWHNRGHGEMEGKRNGWFSVEVPPLPVQTGCKVMN